MDHSFTMTASSRPPRLDPPRRADIRSKEAVSCDDGDGAAATPSCLAGVVLLLLLPLAGAAGGGAAAAVKFYKWCVLVLVLKNVFDRFLELPLCLRVFPVLAAADRKTTHEQ